MLKLDKHNKTIDGFIKVHQALLFGLYFMRRTLNNPSKFLEDENFNLKQNPKFFKITYGVLDSNLLYREAIYNYDFFILDIL